MLFGYSLETVYLTALLVIGLLTILYLFFADLTDVAIEGIPILDPAIILSFITFTTAVAYLFEKFSRLPHLLILLIAAIIAIVGCILLYYFLLLPMRSAEVSLAYTNASLEGQVGKVITPIPEEGFGEIVIESVNGIIAKSAASYDGSEIPYDANVLIIEMKDNTALVSLYDKLW